MVFGPPAWHKLGRGLIVGWDFDILPGMSYRARALGRRGEWPRPAEVSWMVNPMKAVVLVGGKGTRLRPLTYTSTKALLPIVNVPFLDRLVRRLENSGIGEILLAVNHRAAELEEHLRARTGQDRAAVACSVEPEPRGSGGALKFNKDFLDDTFLLLNGDILTDLDYEEVVRFHKEKGALVTVTIAEVADPTRFGVIDTDPEGRVLCWQEKPSMQEARSNWANVGVWVMEPSLLAHIPDNRFVSLEKEVFQELLGGGAPFYAFKTHAYWADIGTPASYAQIHRDILLGKVKAPIPGSGPNTDGAWVAEGCDLASSASLSGPVVVGEQTQLSERVSVRGPSVLGRSCRIGPGSSIGGSILWNNVATGEGVVIENSIIGRAVRVARNVSIVDSVVADDSVIDVPLLRGAEIGPGTMLRPESVSTGERGR